MFAAGEINFLAFGTSVEMTPACTRDLIFLRNNNVAIIRLQGVVYSNSNKATFFVTSFYSKLSSALQRICHATQPDR